MKVKDIPELTTLSVPERILLAEDIWDSISGEEVEMPVPESHKRELDRRFEERMKAPGLLLSLDELQERINRRK